MFSKDNKSARDAGRVRVPSIISAGLRIVGDLVSEGDVQVDGTVEGDVHGRSIIVSEGAAVIGQLIAESVCIRGSIDGKITADKVELGNGLIGMTERLRQLGGELTVESSQGAGFSLQAWVPMEAVT